MRWPQLEYVLKGLFLGLILYAALQLGVEPPDTYAQGLLRFNLPPLIGLVLALLVAGIAKLREGYRIRGRLLIFLLFLLLESPTLVYSGVLGGAIVGAYLIHQKAQTELLLPILGGGALLGVGFVLLRLVRKRLLRLALVLLLAGGLAGGLFWWVARPADTGTQPLLRDSTLFAIQLLLGLPFFYVLSFSGREEETEIEIGALCAALAIGGSILTRDQPQFRFVGIIVPLGLYLIYTMRILPALRVLKYVFRGLSHIRIGRHRQALLALRRALQLDPGNTLAREGFWEVHRSLDLEQLKRDPQTLALVDFDLCLERAGSLLIQGKPSPEQMTEAQTLLALVVSQRPEMKPSAAYWQAVAHTHAREYDLAAARLEGILDPSHFGKHSVERQKVLLSAWQLALLLHEDLRKRVGQPQLAQPGRRMEAIAVVERHLAEHPNDQTIWGLKRLLYHDLTEAEYFAEAETWSDEPEVAPSPSSSGPMPLFSRPPQPPRRFDHEYVQQLGLALINDDRRWQRGGEYLRMAAHGLPAFGPSLFVQIAQAHQRNGNTEGALHNYELAKRAGRSVGPKNLSDSEAQTYFAAVKLLAETAQSRGDLDAAIENYRLFLDSPSSGIETLRTLADLCQRKGDILSAVRFVDMALQYNGKDKDLLQRKDDYYYSIPLDQLRERLDRVRDGFDVYYCVKKAQTILDQPQFNTMEWLDVAYHLIELARIIQPDSLRVKLLHARALLRVAGDRDKAIAELEEIRNPKPERFASGEDEDAWYVSSQMLGDLYMEISRPDLAIPCFHDFRESHRSGAKTLYKLGQAHEQLGDRPKAVKFYKLVTGYDGNPLVSDAYDALHRLGA